MQPRHLKNQENETFTQMSPTQDNADKNGSAC